MWTSEPKSVMPGHVIGLGCVPFIAENSTLFHYFLLKSEKGFSITVWCNAYLPEVKPQKISLSILIYVSAITHIK